MPNPRDTLAVPHRNARIDGPGPAATGRVRVKPKRPSARPKPSAAHPEGENGADGPRTAEAPPKPTTEALSVRADVWAAYARLRSVRAVARELVLEEALVRKVLEADRDRLRVLLDDLHEERAATWERRERRVGLMIDTVLDTYDGLMLEIHEAMTDGRVTRIRNDEGAFLPVLDAIQLVVMSRIADQSVRIAQVSRTLASQAASTPPRAAAGVEEELRGFEAMDDVELAAIVEEAGVGLPPMLAEKLKHVENTAGRNDNAPP